MEKYNPVNTPDLQVTEKNAVTEEHLPAMLAGLYRRVTERLLYLVTQRPDAQQAVNELARGMSYATNVRWARLKRVMRHQVNKRVIICKFEPSAREARDNELTATSDSDWGGCVKTRKKHPETWQHDGDNESHTRSVSLSTAEAEHYGMASALAEAKHVQETVGENHEDTRTILKTDSLAAKAHAERPGCGEMTSVKFGDLQDAITNKEVLLPKTRYEAQCCRLFDTVCESTAAEEQLTESNTRTCLSTCVWPEVFRKS